MNDRKIFFTIIVAAVMLGAWMFRWHVVAQNNGESRGYVYAVDRFTGQIWLIDLNRRVLVKPAETK